MCRPVRPCSMRNLFGGLSLSFLLGVCVAVYQIAPITNDMKDAATAIIANLLPASGVTQLSSVGWQRLAYICGIFPFFYCSKTFN